jgi:Transglycosylase SLT domain
MGAAQNVAFQGRLSVLVFGCLALLMPGTAAGASTQTAQLCEQAAADVAQATGIPADILHALTLTETGREIDGRLRPWPWAINHAGTGHWFDTQDQMLDFAQALLAQGLHNFDLGCFQLNYRWHGNNFASLSRMTDPAENARYAAGYLQSKHQQTGSWDRAIGAYHSATQEFAQRYLARFITILSDLDPAIPYPDRPPAAATPPEDQQNDNSFPLLISGQSGQGPSLFPALTAGRRLIGGAP